jgi:3-oxoacyl-[acyl-carrier protein] reductase
MQLGVQNKVFMVAGGSRGLGYGIASALAGEGAIVALAGRDPAAAEIAAERLRESVGARVLAHACDVRDAGQIEHWRDCVIAEFGGIDGLVVNAGGPAPGSFDSLDDAAWEAAFQLTLMSAVRLIRAVLPSMRERGGGAILALTSSSIKEPDNFLLLSGAMRAGVAALVKGLSRTLAGEGIRINNLVPGIIETDRIRSLAQTRASGSGTDVEAQMRAMRAPIPLGRFGDPEEFGKAGAFLLSEAASYITGATLVIDGGTLKSMG